MTKRDGVRSADAFGAPWQEPTDARGIMRALRFILGKWLIALLITLCLGLQVLEATGRWDQALQDTGDEAVIVLIVLCVGSGIVVAAAMRTRLSLPVMRSIIVRGGTAQRSLPSAHLPSVLCESPPVSLRI